MRYPLRVIGAVREAVDAMNASGDRVGVAVIRLFRPVVLTVHDTVAFNGERISWFQNLGFDWPIRLADRLIVHTRTGKQTLIARGIPAEKVSVIPHGPLRLHVTPPTPAEIAERDPRWTFVLFGEIKPYKGLDLLVEALAALPESTRLKARLVVAGRPRMDLAPIEARIAELGLGSVIEFRARRQSEEEMALLFAQADCFVFPYHQIDASGVYFLTKAFSKWMIASRVGIFAEDMRENIDGRLIPVGSVEALTEALAHAIEARPTGAGAHASDSWTAIGHQTRALYESTLHAPRSEPGQYHGFFWFYFLNEHVFATPTYLIRPEIAVRPDFARAADMGVTSAAIGETLRIAAEKQGYTLTDAGTYLSQKASLDLAALGGLRVAGVAHIGDVFAGGQLALDSIGRCRDADRLIFESCGSRWLKHGARRGRSGAGRGRGTR